MKYFAMLLGCIISSAVMADIWSGSNRTLSQTALGNKVAVSCHNCYSPDDSNVDLNQALQNIHQGQSAGADLIEIDLVAHNNSWVVSHGTTTGPDYADVFADTVFRNGNQIPFIEIKSNLTSSSSSSYANILVNTLYDLGYLNSGKIVVIRSFHTATLDKVKSALGNLTSTNASRVRLSRLYSTNTYSNLSSWQNNIATMASKYDMVEFNYKTKNMASMLEYARSLGLAVNLWTIRSYTEVFSAAFRETVDALTIDSGSGKSREQNIQLAKSVVGDNTNLLHFNMATQNHNNSYYLRYYDQTTLRYIYRYNSAHPDWEWLNAIGEDRYGGSLVLNKNDSEYIRFFDRDNNSNEGFFVHAVVNFDSFSHNPTQAIVNKSDSGGFALELKDGYLRFGVHVNGAYRYVKYSQSNLNGTDAYQIIGAYDGNGGVRMWVDGNEVGSPPQVSGGVTKNNSPIVVGADPQGSSNQRFFFSGKIQQVNVQRWGHH